MKYFPKSQIIPNKYTDGGELQYKKSKNPYKGYYYETSNGKKYTGKNPQIGSNIELEPLVDPINFTPILSQPGLVSSILDVDRAYGRDQNIPFEGAYFSLPYASKPIPTELDIKIGEYTRYFCKKTNEPLIFEVNKSTFDRVKFKSTKTVYQLYEAISIQWLINLNGYNKVSPTSQENNQITVESINAKIVAKAEKDNKWYGFTNYFKNNFGSPI